MTESCDLVGMCTCVWSLCCEQVLVPCQCQLGRVAAASFAGITTATLADVECLHTAVVVATPIVSTAPTSAGARVVALRSNRMLMLASPWQPARPQPTACLVRDDNRSKSEAVPDFIRISVKAKTDI